MFEVRRGVSKYNSSISAPGVPSDEEGVVVVAPASKDGARSTSPVSERARVRDFAYVCGGARERERAFSYFRERLCPRLSADR